MFIWFLCWILLHAEFLLHFGFPYFSVLYFRIFYLLSKLFFFFFLFRLVKLSMDQMTTWSVLYLMELSMTMVSIICCFETCNIVAFFQQWLNLSFFCYSVFDVDIGDGEPIRKLPYNRSGINFVGLVFSCGG